MRYLSSLATQTWLALLAALCFAALILLLTGLGEHNATTSRAIWGLSVTALVVGVTPIVITRLSTHLPEQIRRVRVVQLAGEALGLAGSTARNPRVIASFLGFVLVGLVTGGIGMTVAFALAGEGMEWTTGIALLAFVNLGNVASITPANLGIQELGVAALAVLFEYSPASGVVASVVVRLSNIVALAVLLIIFESEGFANRRPRIH